MLPTATDRRSSPTAPTTNPSYPASAAHDACQSHSADSPSPEYLRRSSPQPVLHPCTSHCVLEELVRHAGVVSTSEPGRGRGAGVNGPPRAEMPIGVGVQLQGDLKRSMHATERSAMRGLGFQRWCKPTQAGQNDSVEPADCTIALVGGGAAAISVPGVVSKRRIYNSPYDVLCRSPSRIQIHVGAGVRSRTNFGGHSPPVASR